MLPPDAAHGAVALAERQTAGRGRLGRTWVDSGLMFSVALYPPQPVAEWPGLTLVAAEAVAAPSARRRRSSTRTTCCSTAARWRGSSPRRPSASCSAIGINVGEAGWPGAGFVERGRLELLVDVLERLERGYERWSATRSRPG